MGWGPHRTKQSRLRMERGVCVLRAGKKVNAVVTDKVLLESRERVLRAPVVLRKD